MTPVQREGRVLLVALFRDGGLLYVRESAAGRHFRRLQQVVLVWVSPVEHGREGFYPFGVGGLGGKGGLDRLLRRLGAGIRGVLVIDMVRGTCCSCGCETSVVHVWMEDPVDVGVQDHSILMTVLLRS